MFREFHQKKNKYNRGQAAPFLILALVVMLMMAMVTVNLSKVSSIKTSSANAADAGGLAGGSMMANAFNALAMADDQMQVEFDTFLLTVSILAGLVVGMSAIYIAKTWAAPLSIDLEYPKSIRSMIVSILLAIAACHIAQYFTYKSIKKSMKNYRNSAIDLAHRMAFYNSGIGSKLKEGPGSRNHRDTFSDFVENIKNGEESYTYFWQDGQGRSHSVITNVTVDELVNFELSYVAVPTAVIVAMLVLGRNYITSTFPDYTRASVNWWGCVYGDHHQRAAHCPGYFSGGIGVTWKTALASGLTAAAVALLRTKATYPNDSTHLFIYLPRNIQRVMSSQDADQPYQMDLTMRTRQSHAAGADLGLWKMNYLPVASYGRVSFQGEGKTNLLKSDYKFDADMIANDWSVPDPATRSRINGTVQGNLTVH